jgi:broad specificity phosphatase PhoE
VRLLLVRHGETAGQSSIRYYGSTDVPLSRLGEEQMRRAGAALAGERFAAVYTSRLRRARLGAALVTRGAHPARPVAALDEVCFGRWEGLTREEIAARDPHHFAQWQADPERFVYPDGECRQAFQRRVATGLRRLLTPPVDATVLLVVHRGVIAVALAELLDLPAAARRDLEIGLGSIHELAFDGRGWRAVHINAIAHLDGLEAVT